MSEDGHVTYDLIPGRLVVLPQIEVGHGKHVAPTGEVPEKACVMELVAWVRGLPWSDSPPCTDPALAALLRLVNDRLADPAGFAYAVAPAAGLTGEDARLVLGRLAIRRLRESALPGASTWPDDLREQVASAINGVICALEDGRRSLRLVARSVARSAARSAASAASAARSAAAWSEVWSARSAESAAWSAASAALSAAASAASAWSAAQSTSAASAWSGARAREWSAALPEVWTIPPTTPPAWPEVWSGANLLAWSAEAQRIVVQLRWASRSAG